MERLMAEYAKQLTIRVERDPSRYGYPVSEVPAVTERMRLALIKRTYSNDSFALRATCKIIGIGTTYKAINDYVSSHEPAR